ncbi:MAG: carbonic anhydrase [Bdellovibrionaceae bacterium]|nr:carbonic anhydrase [Pseudobdellovibrionaceae bacterium]
MSIRRKIFLENKAWVEEKLEIDKHYFDAHANDQAPVFLWIGCSDSRVLPNEITGTSVGDMFVHRNIANLVFENDLNLMSVVTYAIRYLKIKHVIVCGHYGCGGVAGALTNNSFGLLDGWLSGIKKVISSNKAELDQLGPEDRLRKAVDLNVIEQCKNLQNSSVMVELHKEFPDVGIYGWVYDLKTGYLKDLFHL